MSSMDFKRRTELLKVLANPKRLEVMHILKRGKLMVSDMEHMIGIRQANLSQHLMVLRRAGVVATKHEGRKVYYHLTCSGATCISAALRVTKMVGRMALIKNAMVTGIR